MAEHAQESPETRFNMKRQVPEHVKYFRISKRRIWAANLELCTHIEATASYKTCKNFCSDYRRGRKAGDVCDICFHYKVKCGPC